MKALKKTAVLLLTLCLLASLVAAVSADDYTYTVRFLAGGQGSFDGNDRIEITGLAYGSRVTFDMDSVTLNNDSKYYVKGIRESGLDNSTVGRLSFVVTKDQDFVVAYGVLGDSVAYTVHFVTQSGVELAPTRTYYGNIGDKPVVAFQYIDGYLPNFYNLTGTLSANAAENDFTFMYVRDPQTITEQPEETPEPGEWTPGGEVQPEPTPVPQPEEIGDLDLPESNYDNSEETPSPQLNLSKLLLWIIILIAILLLLFLLFLFFIRRRKKKDADE